MTPHKLDIEFIQFDSPVDFVDKIIAEALTKESSDVHVEPFDSDCRIRFRIDGLLSEYGRYDKSRHDEVVARLKILSGLRTDVRFSPQDGRFRLQLGNESSARVSIVPTIHGEKCVLRLFLGSGRIPDLFDLGFSKDTAAKLYDSLVSLQGMVLAVGPTGSGKTTTLYSLADKVSVPDVSVVTLEDPVEYSIPGICQIPIRSSGPMTFSSALRSVVRQDPDVILVGEIRDPETADLSVHSALTGHLVLSTLHTNDSATALLRLIDLGIEPFLVASTVKTVISQRLVRKNCLNCLRARKVTQPELEYLGKNSPNFRADEIHYGAGCEKCFDTGYAGRVVISEILQIDDKIRSLICSRARSGEINEEAMRLGMHSLMNDAVEKVIAGITTIKEIASI